MRKEKIVSKEVSKSKAPADEQRMAIRREKVDWLKIVNLAFKKQDWGKTHVLYTYGSTTISCILRTFDFEDNMALFKLKINFKGGSDYTVIRYCLNNFTVADFKMHLQKKLARLVKDSAWYATKLIAQDKYQEYWFCFWDIKDDDIIKTGFKKDLTKINRINDEALKESCINKLKDKVSIKLNIPYENMVKHHIENFLMKFEGYDEFLKILGEEEE